MKYDLKLFSLLLDNNAALTTVDNSAAFSKFCLTNYICNCSVLKPSQFLVLDIIYHSILYDRKTCSSERKFKKTLFFLGRRPKVRGDFDCISPS